MSVTNPKGKFAILHIGSFEDWDSLEALTDDYLKPHDVERFRSTLHPRCQTVVVERDYVCKDYRDTYTNYYAKKFASYPGRCTRLLFFGAKVAQNQWWNVASYAGSFLGYSVVRPTRIQCIGRTILKPAACTDVKGYLCQQEYHANLLGVALSVTGFPHISQDTDVTICAHAACWMCFRYFSERYHIYREIYPYQITQLTTDLSNGRLLPSNGIYMAQVAEIFSRFGFYPLIYERENWHKRDTTMFNRLLYYYIESGFPMVVGVPGHAFTALGHTSDLHKPTEDGLLFSSDFMTGLIINDDNEAPYQVLPADGEFPDGPKSRYRLDNIHSFVVPLPEKVYLFAEDVERLTLAILDQSQIGLKAQSPSLDKDDLVLRIFLTSSRAYKQDRRTSGIPHGLDLLYALLPMPRLIWVVELTTKQTFVQEQIVGEIIWDATASGKDFFAWLAIHYPEVLIVNDRDSHGGGLVFYSLPSEQTYEMYKHNLHAVT